MTPEERKAYGEALTIKIRERERNKKRETLQKWRAANRVHHNEHAKFYQRERYKANPELFRERSRAYDTNNRERKRKTHTAWRHANRDHVNNYQRKIHYKSKYGITIEERDALLVSQGGCACCGTDQPGNKAGWVVDHCHVTNKVRGVLCHHCNLGIGNAKDNIENLQKMIAYLQRFV